MDFESMFDWFFDIVNNEKHLNYNSVEVYFRYYKNGTNRVKTTRGIYVVWVPVVYNNGLITVNPCDFYSLLLTECKKNSAKAWKQAAEVFNEYNMMEVIRGNVHACFGITFAENARGYNND